LKGLLCSGRQINHQKVIVPFQKKTAKLQRQQHKTGLPYGPFVTVSQKIYGLVFLTYLGFLE